MSDQQGGLYPDGHRLDSFQLELLMFYASHREGSDLTFEVKSHG